MKNKSMNQPLDFDCRITNKQLCIDYEHLIGLATRGSFSKLVLLALNRVINHRVIFELRSPIESLGTTRPGLVQSLTLIGYSSALW